MEYFVPSWHDQLVDWSFNVPHIQFYDGINQMRVLQDNLKKVGLVITDYQPQLTTKLNQLAFSPDYLFSVYDYLQGINTLDNQILNYTDFNWPDDVAFDFTPFRLLVISQGKLYARISFDNDGKILNITYFDENGQQTKVLTIDSRGFVSSEQVKDQITYYDQIGHWRFKYNCQTDEVSLNPTFNQCEKDQYKHLEELISEVFKKCILQNIREKDHLIISLDDKSTVPIGIYDNYDAIYSLNHWNNYTKSLLKINKGKLIVESKEEKDRVIGLTDKRFDISVMPAYQTQFKLGHSQRLKTQIIAIFAEHINYDELKKMTELICQRIAKHPKSEQIQFLTYSPQKEMMVNEIIDHLKNEYKSEFTINKKVINPDEVQIADTEKLPNLIIKHTRVTNIAEVMCKLDSIRILINWEQGDDFLQTAAVSVGIPQLQNFKSSLVINNRNGLICNDLNSLLKGISFYLNNLNHWNEALVYNVRILNEYSEENLMQQWYEILGDEV